MSEVDAVGGFVGTSFSEPVLNGGILLSVFGYMLFMQPWIALIALALFIPQVLFIPDPAGGDQPAHRVADQDRCARSRVDIVDKAAGEAGAREETYRRRVGDVYRLNMQIFRRKFGMTFLIAGRRPSGSFRVRLCRRCDATQSPPLLEKHTSKRT